MRHEVLMEMSEEELDQYAKVCGISTAGAKSAKAKVALIEERRARVAEVSVLGKTYHVPVRAVHTEEVAEALQRGVRSDEEARELMEAALGPEQNADLLARCADEDGRLDVEAYGTAFARIFTSEELKNF